MSGVEVASTMRSMSAALRPAASSALRAAERARSLVNSPSAAIWRWRMPVRETIHSSLVSTRDSSSLLVTTRSGSRLPVPVMREYVMRSGGLCRGARAVRGSRAGRGQGCARARDLLADALEQAVACFRCGAREGGGEREAVRRAMALHYDAAQAEERR